MPQVRERRQAGSYRGCMLRNRPVSPTASRREAADALSVSPDSFDEHVRPERRLVHVGHLVFVAVSELERWRLRRFDPSGCAV